MISQKPLTIILAMDKNNLIGSNNNLPWNLPADLIYFKKQTLNKTILMGRKTCESLPFSLPQRRNIVLTKNINFQREGFELIHNLDCINDIKGEIMVIGGSMIYQLLIPYVQVLLITKIHHEFNGDTYFKWNQHQWQLASEIKHTTHDKNRYNYSFLKYIRI